MYFMYFAAFSGFSTFRNLYFSDIGLTGFQMGLIGAVVTAVGTLAQPVWGLVSDWRGFEKNILVYASIISGLVVLIYPAASFIHEPFYFILIGTGVFAVFQAPLSPVLDSVVLSSLTDYGKARSFGSVSFGVGALIFGLLIPVFSSAVVFYFYTLFVFTLAVLAYGTSTERTEKIETVGSGAVKLLRNRDFFILLMSTFIVGVTLVPGGEFLSVYMDQIGGPDLYTGLSWLIATVVEALVFVYLSRKNYSYRWLVAFGGVGYAVKYLFFFLVPVPNWILVLHLVIGFSFAPFYYGAVHLTFNLVPDSLRTTGQTLLWSAVFGIGAGVGQLLSGYLIDSVGIVELYLYLSAIAFAGSLIVFFVSTNNEARRTNHNSSEA